MRLTEAGFKLINCVQEKPEVEQGDSSRGKQRE